MLELLTKIPVSILLFGSLGIFIGLPLLIFKLHDRYWNFVHTRSEMKATIADLELQLSWYTKKQGSANLMYEILQEHQKNTKLVPQIEKGKAASEEDEVQSDINIPNSSFVPGEISQALIDVFKGESERKQQEQLEMELEMQVLEESTESGPITFTPPPITNYALAEEPLPSFLQKLAKFFTAPKPQADNVISFPVSASTSTTALESEEHYEQSEFEFDFPTSSETRLQGTHWVHFRITENYDVDLANCVNLETGDSCVLQHQNLGEMDVGDVFTALIHYKDNLRHVRGLWAGEYSFSG